MKYCIDCKDAKKESEFNKNQKICRICQSIRHKKFYADNKEMYQQRNAKRRKAFREIVNDIKNTLKCNHCDENDNVVLEFHHKNPAKKDFNISHFMNGYYPNDKNVKILKEEIAKCEVLCANCHRREHHRLKQLNG